MKGILKKILKVILFLIPVGTIIFYLVTSYSMRVPGELKKYFWTESNLSLYERAGDEIDIRTGTTYDGYMTEDGWFGIFSVLYTPQANQFQITLRYNKSTVTKLNEERVKAGLSELKEGEENFVCVLYSEKGGDIFTEYSYKGEDKSRHVYRRMVFENVEMNEDERIWLYVYAKDTVDFESEPQGKLLVYENEYGSEKYTLTDKEPKLTEGLVKVTVQENYEAPAADNSGENENG